ncbi:hypothetical protein [Streptomyces roseochromogenus]|uniref:Uncharacterized protein n=1 Tax=Streptomyces roseochromogenus subsp. oscitans DS 12.976 TaxID=1352936 RepID=V6JX49_STRRC|nr:hypothetical protein [Streptomyces roseochromogenus]EST24402.1 hypothetical protein M878_30790 [Streptomyces roseochromogenus subsp. oscitans DS 12.976]
MTTPQPPTTVDLLVVLTRLETKLDAATAGIADHETRLRAAEATALTEEDVQHLRADVEALKRNRWPLPAIGALAGVGGAIAGLVALFQR